MLTFTFCTTGTHGQPVAHSFCKGSEGLPFRAARACAESFGEQVMIEHDGPRLIAVWARRGMHWAVETTF